ncbi:hypothetical protein [Candidatus Clostridium stratigraminis]|uniref:Uncharacterized protein n=1 Tax=Candidatus Clostridium stratigraminis TaxID=3381661 RepID=A0ABW8T6M1_9CLOT
MKGKKSVYLVVIIIILIAIVALQYRDNAKIKTIQGEVAENKIDWLQIQLKIVSEDLSSTKIPEKEYIDETSAKFSEDTVLLNGIIFSSGMPLTYLDMIRMDLVRMSSDLKNKKSEKEILDTKQLALDKMAILQNELNYIRENCKTNAIKYYQLSKPNNLIMKKIDKEMIDYLNKNNIH